MKSQGDSDGVRRVGRKDRKATLKKRELVFPPEIDLPAGSTTPAPDTASQEPVAAPPPPSAELQTTVAERPAPDSDPASSSLITQHPVPPADDPLGIPAQRSAPSTQHLSPRRRPRILPNLVALLFLGLTITAIVLFVTIANNPFTPLNPFPPFTLPPIIVTATFLPPTATARPTAVPTATFTPLAPESVFPFTLSGEVAYTANTNPAGCAWASIGGTVVDAGATPLTGYAVRVRSAEGTETTVFTNDESPFGPGGFEQQLADAPLAGRYTVQLYDPSGEPVSPAYAVTTQATCEEAVTILAFAAAP